MLGYQEHLWGLQGARSSIAILFFSIPFYFPCFLPIGNGWIFLPQILYASLCCLDVVTAVSSWRRDLHETGVAWGTLKDSSLYLASVLTTCNLIWFTQVYKTLIIFLIKRYQIHSFVLFLSFICQNVDRDYAIKVPGITLQGSERGGLVYILYIHGQS